MLYKLNYNLNDFVFEMNLNPKWMPIAMIPIMITNFAIPTKNVNTNPSNTSPAIPAITGKRNRKNLYDRNRANSNTKINIGNYLLMG